MEIQLTHGFVTVIDDDDADLDAFKWHAKSEKRNVYALRTVFDKSFDTVGHSHTQRLHRVILERKLGITLIPAQCVDHIDNDALNNRRSNLRLVTRQQNGWNRRSNIGSASGYKGVTWSARLDAWQTYIRVDGQRIYLGYDKDPQKAHEFYKLACVKYFGEFANDGGTKP